MRLLISQLLLQYIAKKIMQYDIVLVQIVAVLPILLPVQIAFIITVEGRITGLRMSTDCIEVSFTQI